MHVWLAPALQGCCTAVVTWLYALHQQVDVVTQPSMMSLRKHRVSKGLGRFQEETCQQWQAGGLAHHCLCAAAGKSFEDDDVELICSKSGLESLQSLTEALAATESGDQQATLLQVCCCACVPIDMPASMCVCRFFSYQLQGND